jgi:hypothetical protein
MRSALPPLVGAWPAVQIHKSIGQQPLSERRLQMPKENDLEGQQDQGGKHGGQAGMPRSASGGPSDHGIVRDERGVEQPRDKERAQQLSRKGKADEPPSQ